MQDIGYGTPVKGSADPAVMTHRLRNTFLGVFRKAPARFVSGGPEAAAIAEKPRGSDKF